MCPQKHHQTKTGVNMQVRSKDAKVRRRGLAQLLSADLICRNDAGKLALIT